MTQQLNFQEGEYFDYYSRRTTNSGEVLSEYKYRLKIIADLTAFCICPVCGGPDCGDDMYLWAQFGDGKFAIHLGAMSFSSFFNCWHYEGIKEEEYKKLPEFIRHNNEGTGWCDFDDGPNNEIDAFDFLKSLEVVNNSAYSKDDEEFKTCYPVLKSFAEAVIAKNTTLNALH